MNYIEKLWDDLLSRDALKVSKAFDGLSQEEKDAVKTHLKRMAEENGWHSEQRTSANFALNVLVE